MVRKKVRYDQKEGKLWPERKSYMVGQNAGVGGNLEKLGRERSNWRRWGIISFPQ
jgi:hypothetical protein